MKILRFEYVRADHVNFRIIYGYNFGFINVNFKFSFAKYKTDTSLKFIASSLILVKWLLSGLKACRHKGAALEESWEGFKNYSLKLTTREIALTEGKTARHTTTAKQRCFGSSHCRKCID